MSDIDRVANNLYLISEALRELSFVLIIAGVLIAIAVWSRPH